MRKTFYFLVAAATLFSSCKKVEKDVNDYFPEVSTVSATVQSDGSVLLTGEIVSEGSDPVENAGFCVSTNPVPKMLDDQKIASINGSTFTATYSGFQVQTKYYFRSWAINENGYSYGNIISLDSVSATPLTAPCTPNMNTINIGTGTESFFTVSDPSGTTDWTFQANSNSVNMSIVMAHAPVTKVYTTTSSSSPSSDQIHIYFYSGFIQGSLDAGSEVYVNQTGADSWEFTICNAPWSGTASGYMTARFSNPL